MSARFMFSLLYIVLNVWVKLRTTYLTVSMLYNQSSLLAEPCVLTAALKVNGRILLFLLL